MTSRTRKNKKMSFRPRFGVVILIAISLLLCLTRAGAAWEYNEEFFEEQIVEDDDLIEQILPVPSDDEHGMNRPQGIVDDPNQGLHYHIDFIWAPFSEETALEGRRLPRSFQVEPSFEITKSGGGVRFNVETVEPAYEDDKNMTSLLRQDVIDKMSLHEMLDFYMANGNQWSWDEYSRKHCSSDDADEPLDDDEYGYYSVLDKCYASYKQMINDTTIDIEAMSQTPTNLVFSGGHGFLAACMTSFAKHLPLSLDPTDIWTVIMYGFAKHVELNAEQLRHKFVQHQGKKKLEVRVDHFVKSNVGEGPDSGTSTLGWEQDMFPNFSMQIQEHIGKSIHATIAGNFSTTTATTQAASEITLMSAMKQYFSYHATTACGIPNIELRGTKDDWVSLRSRAGALGDLMTPEFSQKWIPILLPILDEFVNSYEGKVNHGFWQSMVKFRHTAPGSGSHTFVSGWLQDLFPYLADTRDNYHMRPWQEAYFDGPEPSDFPIIRSSCPLIWDYFGTKFELHLHAGFDGFRQDPSDGTLSPSVGWIVTNDPKPHGSTDTAHVDKEL